MESDRDDVLSIDERDTLGEFSGFSPLNSPEVSSSKQEARVTVEE